MTHGFLRVGLGRRPLGVKGRVCHARCDSIDTDIVGCQLNGCCRCKCEHGPLAGTVDRHGGHTSAGQTGGDIDNCPPVPWASMALRTKIAMAFLPSLGLSGHPGIQRDLTTSGQLKLATTMLRVAAVMHVLTGSDFSDSFPRIKGSCATKEGGRLFRGALRHIATRMSRPRRVFQRLGPRRR